MLASAASKAVVKSVLSGDTIVVMGAPANGPPPEKQLTLAGIIW
jgi:staphylococcal nuclease domain-containing protein 1